MSVVGACGLDCYDACRLMVHKNGNITGIKDDLFGDGSLCRLVYHELRHASRIKQARIAGRKVALHEALDGVADALRMSKNVLLWRGSGNVGMMQEVTHLLIKAVGGTLTFGSLCDGAGEAGIEASRGFVSNVSLEQIKQSETVVVWGRNLTVTNRHFLPLIEDKEIFVIDPIAIKLCQKPGVKHLAITPNADGVLADVLRRLVLGDLSVWDDKRLIASLGCDVGLIKKLADAMRTRKTVCLVGVGVQKYRNGAEVLQRIDWLCATLGLFGKEGCGVHYLSNSKLGLRNPFDVDVKRVSKVLTPFDTFDAVIVQGGNPAESMPNSTEVVQKLKQIKRLIYFGLYENATSKLAHIVIPAKNFLEKEDIRLSYGHNYVSRMHTLCKNSFGISEYDFTQALLQRLGLPQLKPQGYYINKILSQCQPLLKDLYLSKASSYPQNVSLNDTIKQRCAALGEAQVPCRPSPAQFRLLSMKSPHGLNTQFQRNNIARVHPSYGYSEGECIKVQSDWAEALFRVSNDPAVCLGCVAIEASTKGVNKLTPPIVSHKGHNACYQECFVTIQRCQSEDQL